MRKPVIMAAAIVTTCAAGLSGARASRHIGMHCNLVRATSNSVVITAFMPPSSARFAQYPRTNERLELPRPTTMQPSPLFGYRCCTLHSTTFLMASKRNGGKSKKAKVKSMSSNMPDDDDDDDESDGTSNQLIVATDENINGSFENMEHEMPPEFTATFASEYHAPVMPTECINALLQLGEWGDMLRARKERWRKKRSIIDAKRRRSIINHDDDTEDDENDEKANADADDDGDDAFDEKGTELLPSSDSTPPLVANNSQHRPRLFVDGTLGGGGHSQALLQQLREGDILVGCDVDPEALSTASTRLSEYLSTCEYILEANDDFVKPFCGWKPEKPMFIPVQSNFRDLITILSKLQHPVTGKLLLGDRRQIDDMNMVHNNCNDVEFPRGANGMLLDLGVSSHQINTSERGFAFMKDGPLDMRMSGNSRSGVLTAADICNEFDESTIIDILRTYGDEPRAKRIASAIVSSRPLHTTTDLVHAINSVTPTFARQKRAGLIATSARVFQALRIVVNEEDAALKEVLERVAPWVLARSRNHQSGNIESDDQAAEGILAVLSYHSMEDKMAKRVMRDGKVDLFENGSLRRGVGDTLQRDLWGNTIGADSEDINRPFEPLTKPKNASDEEVSANSRSRSATLRVAIRI